MSDTLCDHCSSTLRGAECSSNRASSAHLKASGSYNIKDKKDNPALTVSRPGTWGLIMSFAVIACVFGVAFMGPEESTGQITGGVVPTENYPLRQLQEINLEANNGVTYLSPSDTNQKNKIMNSLINNAKKVYLNKNTEMVQSSGLYKKLDLSECSGGVKVGAFSDEEQESAFESISFKLQSLKNATNKNKIDSIANRALPSNSDVDTLSDNLNLPAPINLESKTKEQTMFCGNSEILSSGNLFLQKDE